MIQSRTLGEIRITRVCEYFGPTHDPGVLFPEWDEAVLNEHESWLVPHHWHPSMRRLIITIQLWVVHVGPYIIVVDTGVGNRKLRSAARMNGLNTLVPVWLEAAGAPPEKVTHVVMTHLHPDHIGWNTTLVGGEWVPTFPNARYSAPKVDLDAFSELHENGAPDAEGFDDSVSPLLKAGVLDVISSQQTVGILDVEDAIGHTPGQVNFRIRSGGEQAVFSGDIMHHPLQIVRPDWNTRYCMLPGEALTTRAKFLRSCADTESLFMPMHFGFPHCGYVRRQGDGFVFEPAVWPEKQSYL